jgi:hypothetical protein
MVPILSFGSESGGGWSSNYFFVGDVRLKFQNLRTWLILQFFVICWNWDPLLGVFWPKKQPIWQIFHDFRNWDPLFRVFWPKKWLIGLFFNDFRESDPVFRDFLQKSDPLEQGVVIRAAHPRIPYVLKYHPPGSE